MVVVLSGRTGRSWQNLLHSQCRSLRLRPLWNSWLTSTDGQAITHTLSDVAIEGVDDDGNAGTRHVEMDEM